MVLKRHIKLFLGTVFVSQEGKGKLRGGRNKKKAVKGIQKAKIFPSAEKADQHFEMDSPAQSECIDWGCLNNGFLLYDHLV